MTMSIQQDSKYRFSGNMNESRPLYNRGYYEAKAQVIGINRQREADSSLLHSSYFLLSHDLDTATVVIRRKENAARTYAVNYETGVCECKDYTDCIKPLNNQLARSGSPLRIACKHVGISWELAFIDAGRETYADFMDADPLFTDAELDSMFRQDLDADEQLIWGKVAA